MKTFEVKNGENLATLLRAFPDAEVKALISDGDCWRVTLPSPSTERGPCRIAFVEPDGTVVGLHPSQSPYISQIILVRKDGWTLGATFKDRDAAFKLWEGEWIAEVNLTTGMVSGIVTVDQGKVDELKDAILHKPVKKKKRVKRKK